MTRKEVISCRRQYLKVAAAPCLAAIALVPGLPLLLLRLESSHHNWPRGLWTSAHILMIGFWFGAFWFVSWYEPRVAKRYGYRCGACQKAFVGKLERLLKTGKCPHCGDQVLNESA